MVALLRNFTCKLRAELRRFQKSNYISFELLIMRGLSRSKGSCNKPLSQNLAGVGFQDTAAE